MVLLREISGASNRTTVGPADKNIASQNPFHPDQVGAGAKIPAIGQVFAVKREVHEAAPGKHRCAIACGVASLPDTAAPAKHLFKLIRGHLCIRSTHHFPERSLDDDRGRIRYGNASEIIMRICLFATGIIRARGLPVADTMHALNRNPKRFLAFLKLAGKARFHKHQTEC